jgi:hypothetical protein
MTEIPWKKSRVTATAGHIVILFISVAHLECFLMMQSIKHTCTASKFFFIFGIKRQNSAMVLQIKNTFLRELK